MSHTDEATNKLIEKLWENSNHGTRREDVIAAFNAGVAAERAACALACEEQNTYEEDGPGETFAAVIRARTDFAA